MKPITDIAAALGIRADRLELYGSHKAKIRLEALDDLAGRPLGRYVVVTAITPTPLGEGKTVNTIGLSLGLNRIGLKAACALRQPSMGPIFGVKGSATGGGASQVLPAEDINLHLTGDMHAVTSAHNLLAAALDNHLYHGGEPKLDPASITWRRAIDMNDRALREIRLMERHAGVDRASGFDITAASEVMAVLALAVSYRDLRERLARIIVGASAGGDPVRASDLGVAGAMAMILRDALKPNLLQTSEGTPAFIHAGPFGNIAHGNSSILADRIALRCCDIVVTESGFGADLGFEKFVDIKCRTSGLKPDAAMIVATVRALKVHGGGIPLRPGKPLPEKLARPDPGMVRAGAANLAHMIRIVHETGLPAVVAVNRFPTDSEAELQAVADGAREAEGVGVIEAFARGGEGARDVAKLVADACGRPSKFRFLYEDGASLEEKISTLARVCYNAEGVDFEPAAKERLAQFARWGLSRLPVCVAKTQLSVSHDPALRGVPSGYRIPVQDVRAAAGAGFVYPLLGAIMTMPGLPTTPGAARMDIDDDGTIRGLL